MLPEYILTLDMPFGPAESYSNYFFGFPEWLGSIASAPLSLIFPILSRIVPVWILQKIILLAILFLSGLGAYRLIPAKSAAAYYAGILYMINPFVYVRMMVGQWGILVSYALLPHAIKAFIETLEQGNWKALLKLAVLSVLVGVVQIHGFFLLLLSLFIVFLVKASACGNRREIFKRTIAGFGAIMLLNTYWLLPAFTSSGTILEGITEADILFFTPKASSNLGTAIDIATMHGFWRGGIDYPDYTSLWRLAFAIIIFLAAFGFTTNITDKKRKWTILSFGILGITGYLLALGASSRLTQPVFTWLWENVPYFNGFRDTHRFVMLLALSYAYLGGLGILELVKYGHHQKQFLLKWTMVALVGLSILSPLLSSFSIFGLNGKVKATNYPPEWYEVKHYLDKQEGDYNVLFLPWHGWFDIKWINNEDKRLGNPARHFFGKSIICGDNIEIGDTYSQNSNPVSKYVEFLLRNQEQIENKGELLAPLNIKYIILAHEADYENYRFLFHQDDIKVSLANNLITLFENNNVTGMVYAVDNVVYIESLNEYLELSKTQNVMQNLYILGTGEDSITGINQETLKCEKTCPVEYYVSGSYLKYTVFTINQEYVGNHWRYNGDSAAYANLGIMPVFKSSANGGKIVNSRFYKVYLPGYLISALTLGVVLFGVYYKRRVYPGEHRK